MSSPETTPTADYEAVAEALRRHDRFLVTTHENPDGDALGSLLATTLALRQLGKDVATYLAGDAPLPGEYHFMALDDLQRSSAPRTRAIASWSASTVRTRAAWDLTRRSSRSRRSSSTSTTTTTTRASAT